MNIPEMNAQKNVQKLVSRALSSQNAIAQKNAIEAYVRIPQKPVAHPALVPDHGSSRSVPMSQPRARARRNPIKTDGSIEEKR
jgi:hypothetical protein